MMFLYSFRDFDDYESSSLFTDYAEGNFSEETPPPSSGDPDKPGVSSLPNIVEIDVIPGSQHTNTSKNNRGGKHKHGKLYIIIINKLL